MEPNVDLSYRRVGLHYSGTLGCSSAAIPFEKKTFEEMMMMAHAQLLLNPGAGLRITRTERAGLFPIQLEPKLLRLLLENPAEYIRVNTIPDRTVRLSSGRISKLAATYQVPSGGLRAGYDTLASAFGDSVYLRLHRGKVENPVSGRWNTPSELQMELGVNGQLAPAPDSKDGWFVLTIEQLLRLQADVFYLPREWNKTGPWINKSQLQAMYDQFRKDSNQCL